MRILLATDGSAGAATACTVVASTAWPARSVIRIVTVTPPPPVVLGLDWTAATPGEGLRDERGFRPEAVLGAVRESFAERQEIEVAILEGRPASAIIDEARAFDADLVCVGSRGRGPWQTMVLGSVSAEVVDHAPCPVLVVRGPVLEPIVLATDGSDGARRAEALLERWPRPAGAGVTVVTAVETSRPVETGLPLGLGDQVMASWQEGLVEARRAGRAIAEAGAARLRAAGIDAQATSHEGDPAAVIVETARAAGAGLIVAGTRGHGGVTRILLGSVARNVLLHAPCSVLVVRPMPRTARSREPAAVTAGLAAAG